MIFVYVLAKLEAGTENEVLAELKTIKQVRKASLTYGIYDICIEALFKSLDELDDFVFNIVRKIHGVRETATLVTSRSVSVQPEQAVSFG